MRKSKKGKREVTVSSQRYRCKYVSVKATSTPHNLLFSPGVRNLWVVSNKLCSKSLLITS